MIEVLRLGHRIKRDKRITTHVGLVARAFGASKFTLSGDEDPELLQGLQKVSENWGDGFFVRYVKNWRRVIRSFSGLKVYLTMYGVPVQKKIDEIRDSGEDLLLIVGSEKVPPDLYKLVDINIAVTNQPHSEVAALAVFLDHYFQGKELEKKWKGGKFWIIPQEKGKKVLR